MVVGVEGVRALAEGVAGSADPEADVLRQGQAQRRATHAPPAGGAAAALAAAPEHHLDRDNA